MLDFLLLSKDNNVLASQGIFKGVLSVRAHDINCTMKVAAVTSDMGVARI